MNRIRIAGVAPSEQTIRQIKSDCSTVLLSFSGGKDAVAAWLALRDHVEIVPFYGYLIPDLEFVEEGLTYYENFFETRIIRIPHPSFYRWLNSMIFTPPQRCDVIEECDFPNIQWGDVQRFLRDDYNLPDETLTASGVRCADSPQRRTHFVKHGEINYNRMTCYPVWDWKNAAIVEAFRANELKLAPDYRLFGRSFDGLDYRFLKPISIHRPRDFQRILEWFPLADVELFRGDKLKD